MIKKTIPFEDIHIGYCKIGEGDPLVLIHGFCEDSSMWQNITPELSTDHQVILIDLPGFGASTCSKNHLSVSWMATMVNEVLRVENISLCTMMGHSLGAYVALHFAEIYPEKLNGLGFINSHAYADDPEKKKNRDKSIQFITRNTGRLFIRELFLNLFTETYKTTHPDVIKQLIANAQNTISDRAVINALQAMRDREDKSFILRDLSVSVFFLIGRHDQTIPFEISMKQTYLAPISQVELSEISAHMCVFEDSEFTQRTIHSFVKFCYNR